MDLLHAEDSVPKDGRKKRPGKSPVFTASQKNSFFDKLTEVTKAAKTSNSNPKCMWILERFEL